jgi:hypothetical protein
VFSQFWYVVPRIIWQPCFSNVGFRGKSLNAEPVWAVAIQSFDFAPDSPNYGPTISPRLKINTENYFSPFLNRRYLYLDKRKRALGALNVCNEI